MAGNSVIFIGRWCYAPVFFVDCPRNIKVHRQTLAGEGGPKRCLGENGRRKGGSPLRRPTSEATKDTLLIAVKEAFMAC